MNEAQTRKTAGIINKSKCCPAKVNNIDKPLTLLIKKKGEKPQINTIKLDREGGNREREGFFTHEAVFAPAQQMQES